MSEEKIVEVVNKVHQRVNVRVLELIDTHSKGVIQELMRPADDTLP